MPEEKTPEELLAEQAEIQKGRGDFPGDEGAEDDGDDDKEPSGDKSAAGEADGGDAADDSEPSGEGDGEEDRPDDTEDDDKPDGVSASEKEEEKKPIQIPKARFDEANEKARQKLASKQAELDVVNEKLQSQVETTDAKELRTEIEGLEDKWEDLLVEGEVDKARTVRKELRAKQEQFTELRLTQQTQSTGRDTIEQIRFDTQLAAYEVKHPEINPASEDFKQGLADEVSELVSAFQSKGYTAAQALNKAVGYVIREVVEEKEEDKADGVRKKRAAAARKKVAAAKKQGPPDTADAGKDSDKIGSKDGLPDITRMSPDQFDKLTPDQLSEIRQDRLSDGA